MKRIFKVSAFIISVFAISCSPTDKNEDQKDFQFPEKVNLKEMTSLSASSEDQFFARPNIVEPISNEGFIIADVQRLQLNHFDEAANFLGSYGREGQGPGEFQRISDLIIKGNVVQVVDGRSSKITTYEVKDEKLTRVDIREFDYLMMKEHPAAMMREFIANSDDSYTALYYDFNMTSKENPRVTKIVMVPYTSSFERDTTQTKFALDFIPEFEYEGGILTVPYAKRGLYAKTNNHLVYAVNTEPSIKFFDKSGNITNEISLRDKRKALTSEEKEEAFISTYKNAENPNRFKNEVLSLMPEKRSLIRGLLADANDRIWVKIFSEDSLNGDWLVFDKEGNAKFSLNLPEGHTFRNAFGNRLFTQRQTEDGPEIVISEWE